MAYAIFRQKSEQIIPDEKEVFRYLGYAVPAAKNETMRSLVSEAIRAMQGALCPEAVYSTFPFERDADAIYFAGIRISSCDLLRNLAGCSFVTVFAATIGARVDALIRRTQIADSARALVLQAAGAMFIEVFCNNLNDMIDREAAAQNRKTRKRYSPGYGDVPLAVQKQIFSLLPCQKIGLTLMDSLVMAPEKSVTAFIGIE